jgi:hypothetical protein
MVAMSIETQLEDESQLGTVTNEQIHLRKSGWDVYRNNLGQQTVAMKYCECLGLRVYTSGLGEYDKKCLENELRQYPDLIGFKIKPYFAAWLVDELNRHIDESIDQSLAIRYAPRFGPEWSDKRC